VRTFFDTTWDPDGFPSETRAEIHELLPYVDVFLPNEVEACGLTGRSGDVTQAARDLQLVSSGWVVVTLGASGCFAVGPGGVELTVPASAIRVTDTTGAGDAFNAGLVRALARGAGWREALTTATRFATTVISRPSGQRWKRFVSTPV
jgi:argininosuccinate lyase